MKDVFCANLKALNIIQFQLLKKEKI